MKMLGAAKRGPAVLADDMPSGASGRFTAESRRWRPAGHGTRLAGHGTRPAKMTGHGTRRFGSRRRQRGVALLLVMIALVVGTILTAGYLGTQSTSIGIARNTRDGDKCREIAESGADLCMWLVRNRSDWRTAMAPGNWLTNYSLAGGTVTVTAADTAGNSSFTTDDTKGVTFTSTATLNGRTFTTAVTMTPTGGGVPWSGGAFTSGTISLLDTSATDSFNSSVGAYATSKGSSATLWTNSTASGSIQIGLLTSFLGTLTTNPLGIIGSILNILNLGLAPAETTAVEPRTAGNVVTPNTSGFTNPNVAYATTTSQVLPTSNIIYNGFSLSGSVTIPGGATINQNAVYYINGNMTIDQYSTLTASANENVVFWVSGNVTIAGKVTVKSGASLQIYYGGTVDVSGTAVVGTAATPGQLQLLGVNSSGLLRVRNSATLAAAVFAPNSAMEVDNTGTFYGSSVGAQLTVQNTAKFHQDLNLRTLALHNVWGGSNAGDYQVRWSQ